MKIAIISDIHEDYDSLVQVARLIGQNRCDEVFCLGDIVGYSVPFYDYLASRNASACIAWVRSNCKYVVAGNHDLFAARKVPSSGVRDFEYPENWYNLSFGERKSIANDRIWLYEDNELSACITEDEKEYIKSLPEHLYIHQGETKCLLSHFIFPDFSGSAKRFIYAYDDIDEHMKFMADHGCSISFTGHMHCEGLLKSHKKEIKRFGFGKKIHLAPTEWVGVPSVSNSKNSNGFLLWDTIHHKVETISIRKKLKML